MKWLEYPPDANHGFYVGSAVISAVLPADDQMASKIRANFTDVPRQFSTYWEHFNSVRDERELVF